MPKSQVYRGYLEACEKKNQTPVGRSKFYNIWKEILPHVDTMKPASDLCFDCQQLMSPISKSGHLSEEEKTERIQKVETHLSIAKAERDLYNREIRLNKESLDIIGSIEDSHHRADEIHVSYVFAHQLHCLNNTQQPGLAYFLSMRKCQLFGVTCEAMGQRVSRSAGQLLDR